MDWRQVSLETHLALQCVALTSHWSPRSLNPARSIGPDVRPLPQMRLRRRLHADSLLPSQIALRQFDKTSWIYWVGPGLGAVLAAAIYKSAPPSRSPSCPSSVVADHCRAFRFRFAKFLEYETVNPQADSDGNEEDKPVLQRQVSVEEPEYTKATALHEDWPVKEQDCEFSPVSLSIDQLHARLGSR